MSSHRPHPSPSPPLSLTPPPPDPIARLKLSSITPHDGAPSASYLRSVDALSGSLMRHNAAIIELGSDDATLLRCALEGVRMYFRAKTGKTKGVYTFRAGRVLEDGDFSPPCMGDAFRCLGRASRAALGAITRHLRLRNDVFNNLLDDTPLAANEVSSSVLVAACSSAPLQNCMGPKGGKPSIEVEKGLLTLVSSDCPGIQVCDANGRWYLADGSSGPGDLLLLTGRALSHVTCGLRPAASYRSDFDYHLGTTTSGGRASLKFRLMPQDNAVLDSSPVTAAGHVTPQSFQPISVRQFMDDLSAEEDVVCNQSDMNHEPPNNIVREPSLRSILSDPISGVFLEDAMVVSCGHSFGGYMLRKILEMARCSLCHEEIDPTSLIPNLALRAAASAVKTEDARRLFHNAALRKRRKEVGYKLDALKRLGKENGEIASEGETPRIEKGVQYPFEVNEHVLIKGNRRTADKYVGREAVITSQCLNGWYLVKILDSDVSVRLQYRSLQTLRGSQSDRFQSHTHTTQRGGLADSI